MTKYLTIPAVVAGALGMGSTIAFAAEPTTAELMDQIKQLQSKVAELETRQTTLSDVQVSATIDSVLRDAEKRSQLFAMEGFTAGHDGANFWFRSADGAFALSPRFQFQFRNVTNFRSETDKSGDSNDSSNEHGFEIRRMKLEFVGNAISPDLTYNFRWATDRDGGGVFLENAYIMYQFNDQWAFRAGQWKDNVYHEETTSSAKQLAADRSLINEVMAGGNTDYVQGASLIYNAKDSPFRAEIALTDGANTDNTTFQDAGGINNVFLDNAPNFGVSGRVEWAANNNFAGYDDFTARGNTDSLLVIGAGVNYTQGGSADGYFHTVDVQWEGTGGLGFYAAYVGQYFEDDTVGGSNDAYNWGLLAQVGYMFADSKWEVFGRGNWFDLDDAFQDPTSEDGEYYELTAGVNYYFTGHNAKFTLDGGWLPEGAPADFDGIGVLAGDDNQFYIRGQFQLLI